MLKKLFFSVVLFFAVIEIALRIQGRFKTSNERVINEYFYRYHQERPGWVHNWKPNKITDYREAEFSYQNSYNEFGIRELPLDSFLRDTSSIHVLCLGDSFTEGDGAPYDSSWVRQTEYLCNQAGKGQFRFYDAGVCGSDVFFNHQWLKTDLMRFKPEQVVECINSSDIDDVLWFGGAERFNADGTTSGKAGPRWEIFYKYSHLVRAFAHAVLKYNNNLIKTGNEQVAIALIKNELIKTDQWCRANGIEYKAVLQLCPHELKTKDERAKKLFDELGKLDFVVDLSDELQTAINDGNYLEYSWPLNGHFNSLGYCKLGGIIYKRLYQQSFKKAV